MHSFVWRFINQNPFGLSREAAYFVLVFFSILLPLPRFPEIWFIYTVVAYPATVMGVLQFTKSMEPSLARLQSLAYRLLKNEEDYEQFDISNIKNLNILHWLSCLTFAIFLAAVNLSFNLNPEWSRFTDAAALFYLGFLVGEVPYLLAFVALSLSKLSEPPLKLNPIDPANTADLRAMSETTFSIFLKTGFLLAFLNMTIGVAGYLYPHLNTPVLIISIVFWLTAILLAVYPQFIFWGIVEEEKQATMRTLEDIVAKRYDEVLQGDESSLSSIEEIIKLHDHIAGSSHTPLLNNAVFSVITVSVLNLIPIIAALLEN